MNKLVATTILAIAVTSAVASAQTAEELKIKVKSEYKVGSSSRDPFWPVGWQKPLPPGAQPVATSTSVAPTPPPAPVISPSDFNVTSIATGHISLAVINGKAYAEGEFVPVNTPQGRINVQVYYIRDGQVALRYQNKTVVSELKRREAVPH